MSKATITIDPLRKYRNIQGPEPWKYQVDMLVKMTPIGGMNERQYWYVVDIEEEINHGPFHTLLSSRFKKI